MEDKIFTQLYKIEMALNRIADALTAQALPDEPNFVRDLAAFPGFDWHSIGAQLVEFDDPDGQQATIVRWGMHEWTRKSAQNKFGQAIIFSRAVGKDEYLTLIKFRSGGGVDPVAFEVPRPALAAPAQPRSIPGQVIDNCATFSPPAGAAPATQPEKFLYEMRQALKIDDREIKRRLQVAGIKAFPAVNNEAAYAQLSAMLRQGEVG